MIDFRKRLSDDDARRAFDRFEQRFGRFGEREHRILPIVVEEVRESGAGGDAFTVKGHGIVYNRLSLDLGGFQERIAPGALDDVLDGAPDVHLLWDHDTRFALARTRSQDYQLELRTTPRGVHYWARVAPTSYARDLRVLMEGGVIDQASFAFTVAPDGESWEVKSKDGRDVVVRTIEKIDGLYDITITAQGAYPQADSTVVRSYALHYAHNSGRLADERGADSEEAAPTDPPADTTIEEAAPSAPQVESPEDPTVDLSDTPVAPPEAGGDPSDPDPDQQLIRTWKQQARLEVESLRRTLEKYQ
jgi:HK97 family phage prohead protease